MTTDTLKRLCYRLYNPLRHWADRTWGYRAFLAKSRLRVADTAATLACLRSRRVSVSRFGDGEFKVMEGLGNGFQSPDAALAARLRQVAREPVPGHVVCLPYALCSVSHMTADARDFWQAFIGGHRRFLLSAFPVSREYLDASFTRFYIDWRDKSRSVAFARQIRELWAGRDVLVVEGAGSCLGVGNDLLASARSVRRILCPPQNAFSCYPAILSAVRRHARPDTLVLCALGMTATVLAYDLAREGYQAMDVGHVDLEYEWCAMGVSERCVVPGRDVCELRHRAVSDSCHDAAYLASVVERVTE